MWEGVKEETVRAAGAQYPTPQGLQLRWLLSRLGTPTLPFQGAPVMST